MTQSLRHQVRAFLGGQSFRPHCDAWMSGFDPDFSRALGERGWIGMTWPCRHGGGERSERDRLAVIEELLAAGAPVAAHWMADRQIGPALIRHGTDEQCSRYLTVITRGELFFAVGMSEPDSGSDLASIRTTARPDGSGWRVTGRKVWTSHAARAHFLLALVRTEPQEAASRHAGLTQLIIDLSAPGVTIRPIRGLDGERHFNEVTLDEVAVGADAVLGQPGLGWQQVTSELAYERSGPERFLSTMPLLSELARRRNGHADPQIGQLIAELATLRSLSAQIADTLQRGAAPAREAAMVKDLGARFEGRVIAVARELVGTEPALDAGDELARLLAEAVLNRPGGTLRGGSTEILRGIVAGGLVTQ